MIKRIKLSLYNRLDWQPEEKFFSCIRNLLAFRKFSKQVHIKTLSETINALVFSDCSMARFGDGEIKVIFSGGNEFQSNNLQLAERLKEILLFPPHSKNMLICIPNINEYRKEYTDDSLWFWNGFVRKYGNRIKNLILPNYTKQMQYYSADVTRFYLELKDKSPCADYFEKLKSIWNNKSLLIVEGENTKFGIGNDFIENASSVKRIICPSKDAFSKYDEILQVIIQHHNDELILIALGMTATVLAFDLHTKYNIRAFDIGHLDIEYEWFLKGAKERIQIPGKHTAEMPDNNSNLNDAYQKIYSEQIIARIF